jgi:hypothetical protein
MNARMLVVIVVALVAGWALVRALTRTAPPPPRTVSAPRATASHAQARDDRALGGGGNVGADARRGLGGDAMTATSRGISGDLEALATALERERSPELYVFPNPAPGVKLPMTFRYRHATRFWDRPLSGMTGARR